ncbi:uncharacterized protein [Dermacentor albipictus]|uniref:uncharacterized protein n=1 Tax=Dermacentor albipictus TaxID=60249 RepID=UPI0038FC3058
MPQLPEEHRKIIIRPRGGLNLNKVSTTTTGSAFIEASRLTEEEAREDVVCPNFTQNILVVSTPKPEHAAKTRSPRPASELCLSCACSPLKSSGHGNNATMRLTNIFRFCLFQLVTASSPSPAAAPYRCCNGALPHVLQTENPAPSDASSADPRVATPAPVPVTLPGWSTASSSTSTSPLYLAPSALLAPALLNYWHRPQQFSGHGNNATMRLTNIFRLCLFQLSCWRLVGRHFSCRRPGAKMWANLGACLIPGRPTAEVKQASSTRQASASSSSTPTKQGCVLHPVADKEHRHRCITAHRR